VPEKEARVEHGEDSLPPAPVKPLSPELTHGLLGAQEVPCGDAPQGHDDRGVDDGNLCLKVWETRLNLFKGGGPVPRGSALHHIGDVHLFSLDAHRKEDFREELPCFSDKGAPGTVFVLPRGLADEHDKSVRVPLAENRLGPVFGQGAKGTPLNLLSDLLEKLFLLSQKRTGHPASPEILLHCTTPRLALFRHDLNNLVPVTVDHKGVEELRGDILG